MTAVIQKLYAARARFHAKASQIKQFVRLHRLDGDLRRRIEDWFITHWSLTKGINTEEMLNSFPKELQADICLHLYRSFLTLPCFLNASRGCLRALSLRVSKVHFGPGEVMIKEKDAINCLFFVQRGTIEIVQKGCIVAILGSGDIFGEDISEMKNIRRAYGDVRALMHTEILLVTRESLRDVLKSYPEFAQEFSSSLELTFDLSNRARFSESGIRGNPLRCIEEESEDASIQFISGMISDSDSDSHDQSDDESSTLQSSLPLWQRQLQQSEARKRLSLNSVIEVDSLKQKSTNDIHNIQNAFTSTPEHRRSLKETLSFESDRSRLFLDYGHDQIESVRQAIAAESGVVTESCQSKELENSDISILLEASRLAYPNMPCKNPFNIYFNPDFPSNVKDSSEDATVPHPASNSREPTTLPIHQEDSSISSKECRKSSMESKASVFSFQERTSDSTLAENERFISGRNLESLRKYPEKHFMNSSMSIYGNSPMGRTRSEERLKRPRAFVPSRALYRRSMEGHYATASAETNDCRDITRKCVHGTKAINKTPTLLGFARALAKKSQSKNNLDTLEQQKLETSSLLQVDGGNHTCNSDSGISVTELPPENPVPSGEQENDCISMGPDSNRTDLISLSKQRRANSLSDDELHNNPTHNTKSEVNAIGSGLEKIISEFVREFKETKLELKLATSKLANIDSEIETMRNSLSVITLLVRNIADKNS